MFRTTRLAAAALAALTITGAAAVPADAAGHRPVSRPQVVISQVQYNAPGRGDRALDNEWVTVTNNGRGRVDLSRWTLSDSARHTYRFGHVVLGARQSVRVHTGTGRNTTRDLYQDSRGSIWDAHDTAILRDAAGHVVASKSWGTRHR